MTKILRILAIIIIVVGVFVALRPATFTPPLDDRIIYQGIIDEFEDLTVRKLAKYETTGNITGIELRVYGQMNGNGILTIGYSDSTVYRDYKLDSGKIDLDHRSDWYSNVCYVTFTPTEITNGNLQINCNFIGD